MSIFVLACLVAVGMIILTCAIHFEAMHFLSQHLPRLKRRSRHLNVAFVVGGMFVAHVAEIWAFGICFYLIHLFGLGTLEGQVVALDFWEYLYFSTVSYTSLGLGEVFPTGMLRLLTGVEALAGLVMIAWTASLTYLVMGKYWKT